MNAPAEFVDFAVEKVTDAVFSPPQFTHSVRALCAFSLFVSNLYLCGVQIDERKSVAGLDYDTLKASPQAALTEVNSAVCFLLLWLC